MREARRRTWARPGARRFWVRTALGFIFVLGAILGVGVLRGVILDDPYSATERAFWLGLLLGAYPCLVWHIATSTDGSASWRTGAEAEGWTARELRALGSGWRIEHNVPFPEPGYVVDVDHVAVGPHGVLVLETKWTSDEVNLRARRLPSLVLTHIKQASGNAHRVRAMIRRVTTDAPVLPVLILWGPNVTPPVDSVRVVDGVRVVAGKDEAWRARLTLERVDDATVERIAQRVRDWRLEQEVKAYGATISRRMNHAKRLGWVSVCSTVVAAALLACAAASDAAARVLSHAFLLTVLLLLPLVAATAGLLFVWRARRLDPTIAWLPRLAPAGIWLVGFSTLGIVVG